MYYIDNETSTTEKFDLAKFMEFGNDGVFDCLNSYMLYEIPRLPVQGTYIIRTEEHRPDMLAYHIYGDTQYWWILLWYNNMLKPQDIKNGITISYPSLSNINQLYMNASLYQKVI